MSLNIQETLLDNSSTAMSNLFAVTFTSNDTSNESLHNWTYHINGSVNFPGFQMATVDLPFKDTSLKKELPGITIDRSFNIVFRIDSSYELYKLLLNYFYITKDFIKPSESETSEALEEVPSIDIAIKLLGELKNNSSLVNFLSALYEENPNTNTTESSDTKTILFKDCKITNIQSFALGYESSTANSVTVSFIYSTLEMDSFL